MEPAEPKRDDLFVVPYRDGQFFLYAPLTRCVAVVNAAAVSAVRKYVGGRKDELRPVERDVVFRLEEAGLLSRDPPAPPVFPKDYPFRPHEVTLFLTSRCNLRCRYCYADAGRKSVDMPWEVARAAIDLVATNAGLLGARRFAVGFHGGGEPTMAWDMLVRCVEYARCKASELGLDVDLHVATNGLICEERRRFLIEHFSSINVSLDGPQEIQDRNRPSAAGGGSFAQVAEALDDFTRAGLRYGIRATVTAATVGRMAEVVDALLGRFTPDFLHLEPSWFCGRCATTGEQAPPDDEFIVNFAAAVDRGLEVGRRVTYSGARLDMLTSKFCAAPGDGFSVLPEGVVTSCYEVTETDDPRAARFHYGRFVPEKGEFSFNHDRIDALRCLSVEHLEHCADCFCKWHCAGDCLAKALSASSTEHRGSIRCKLNRALTLSALERVVRAQAGTRDARGEGDGQS